MTLPRDECGPLVEELLDLYRQAETLTWKPRYIRVQQFAHGWYMRVRRGVEAVLELEAAGYAAEAGPIRRSIIEHVVALKWLGTEGDQMLDTAKRGHLHGIDKLRKSIVAADWKSVDLGEFDKAMDDLQDADPSHDNMLHFVNRARAYGIPDDVPQWYAETAISHPCYESAIAYWDLSNKTPIEEPVSVDQMGFCLSWLLTATLVFRDLFEPSIWRAEVDEITRKGRAIDEAYRRSVGMADFQYPELPA
jgi:hypothetical protein